MLQRTFVFIHSLPLQVYISACFNGIHHRPTDNLTQSQTQDVDCEPSYELNSTSRQRCVPAVLNELSMDTRLIKFLETKGHKVSSGMVVKIPEDELLRDQSVRTEQDRSETNFIDMLTQKLAEQASLQNKSADLLQSSKDCTSSNFTTGKMRRRLDNLDIVDSPRFRQRRDAMANIMDTVDVKKLRKQLSVPANLGAQSFFQLAMPEVSAQKVTQLNSSLAF